MNSSEQNIKPKMGCRQVIGYLLGVVFLLGGLLFGAAGIEFGLEKGKSDDVWFAIIMGGMLVFIGVLIIWGVRRQAKRQAMIDSGMLTGIGMAHMMNMDDYDDGDVGD